MPDTAKVEVRPGLFMLYGDGCDIIIKGERHLFCDNCQKCPFNDCKAGGSRGHKYRFRLMGSFNNGGNGHK
jgi:hypothetical protein